MAIDVAKLTEIEGMLDGDMLADAEVVDSVWAAGLPELARVLSQR